MTNNNEYQKTIYNTQEKHLLPLIPARDAVVLPGEVHAVALHGPQARATAEQAIQNGEQAALFTLQDPTQPVTRDNLYLVGTAITLRDIPHIQGLPSILAQGHQRLKLVEVIEQENQLACRVEVLLADETPAAPTQAHMRAALTLLRRVLALNADIPAERLSEAREVTQPGPLADLIANTLSLTFEERLHILRTLSPAERLRHTLTLLGKAITVLEIEEEIGNKLQEELARDQRETVLREKIRVLQNELGEGDIFEQELNDLHARIREANLPEDVHNRAMKEAARLTMLPPMAPEIGLLYNYIDWLVSLPWRPSTDNLDLNHAQAVLNRDHYGLPRVKDRVLEHIAVRQLAAENTPTPILCFLGPPGTGKTSLGKSIARALGRDFARVSLGGVRDEAEIRGHRRTYIGAMPGRILQTMRRAGSTNPVIMLDEIDKLGVDFHGDPAAALLEVLDPEQNPEFFDHFIDMPYDLSQVFFITTANDLSPLPVALEDRLEVIEFPGYIEEEKLAIARQFLIPRQLEAHGLPARSVQFQTSALKTIIQEYTYEAGIRSLNRRIAEMLRKVARQTAEGKTPARRISTQQLVKNLGPPEYIAMRANDQDQIGVVTGLAWTSSGGDVMTIEVSMLPGKGELVLTGQLGDIMQESAQIALSYMRRIADAHNIDHDDFENYDLHIHLPEGAVPKDGPSAGVTLAVAIISVMTDRKVRSDVAMTGEITLRGKILPVGGIREKVMAARRAHIDTLILPAGNHHDLSDIPRQARRKLNILLVEDMSQILETVLRPPHSQTDEITNP